MSDKYTIWFCKFPPLHDRPLITPPGKFTRSFESLIYQTPTNSGLEGGNWNRVKIEITIIEIRRVGLTAKFVNHQLERLVEEEQWCGRRDKADKVLTP